MKGGTTFMASKVEKKSVSLPLETIAQLEWLTSEVFRCYFPVALSKQIQMAISYAYFQARAVKGKDSSSTL